MDSACRAVTGPVRAVLDDVDEEDREYLVLSSASLDCLPLLDAHEAPVRIVVAADVDDVSPAGQESLSAVRVAAEVPWRQVAAVHADSDDARGAVAAARDAVRVGSGDADRLVEACLDHELGWFGTQEVDDLLVALARV